MLDVETAPAANVEEPAPADAVARLRRIPASAWVTLVLVAGSVLFVYLHLQPRLLWTDTTPAGGDMGAHVWAPAYLRDELLPRLRWSGWTPDWYAGFPAYHFYMVVPSLFIVVLDLVLPYNVAFKLVSVSGLVALPLCGYALGRLARLPYPMPAALAVATVPFVFERSFHIYGGNAASTLAGEFAFSISLAFALLFVGVVIRGLDTGRRQALAAVLLAFCVTCHLIPAVFALAAAVVAWLVSLERARLRQALAARAVWVGAVTVAGGLLTSFWTVPFVLQRAYLNDMGWEKVTAYWEALFPGRVGNFITRTVLGNAATAEVGPGDGGEMTWVVVLALLGAGASIAFRRRFGIFLLGCAAVMAVAFVLAPQGRLWNARLLPFWYLCLYLLAAMAVAEVVAAVAVLASRSTRDPDVRVLSVGPVVLGLVVLVAVGLPLRALPFGKESADGTRYSWLTLSSSDRSFIPDWVRWNYSGYERKAAWPEYESVVQAMDAIGQELGCGRAMWEYEPQLDRFGTPMAPMLLPYWTDGCIGSMEGLYFEASATTPYHFLNQSELSATPSRPQRDLPYGALDIPLGVDHLQLLGVRYYLAFSAQAVAAADAEEDLRLLDTVGQWRIYEVAGVELVSALTAEPVVVEGADRGGRTWLDLSVPWYLDRSRWDVPLAASGPDGWASVDDLDSVPTRRLPPVEVSEVAADEDTISFEVDRTGVPVLVRTSYFPNWEVSGGRGPYRVTPNLMVVVPTEESVTLTYGRTAIDWLGIVLSLLGVALTILLARRGHGVGDDEEEVAPSTAPA